MTLTKENKKALAELYVIILNMDTELQEKIPIDVKQNITEQMDKSHWYELSMETLPETKALLSIMISEYLSEEEDKKKFKELDNFYNKKSEEIKKIKYSPDAIFNEKNQNNEIKSKANITKYKEPIFKRIMKKIKSILKKK